MLWQLKKISTNEPLNEPGELPQNWGPIFGLLGVKDKLGDLSWLGSDFNDMGWFEVEGEIKKPKTISLYEREWNRAKKLLAESDWALMQDVPMYKSEREKWVEYRKALRFIKYQKGFPDNIEWPVMPK